MTAYHQKPTSDNRGGANVSTRNSAQYEYVHSARKVSLVGCAAVLLHLCIDLVRDRCGPLLDGISGVPQPVSWARIFSVNGRCVVFCEAASSHPSAVRMATLVLVRRLRRLGDLPGRANPPVA